jgi:tRNA threonylcarbamoyl adenosine modification protein (Sua5/YciO/YrdC/YwlC family)
MPLTRLLRVRPENLNDPQLLEAAEMIRKGALVIVPTETVYGIAANSRDKKALARLSALKERPADKPFSLHIASVDKLDDYARDIPAVAYRLVERFWPGPLTLIFKAKDKGTIGIRLPDDAVCRRVIALSGVPVVCPSANLAGHQPPIDCEQALKDLNGKVELALDAGPTKLRQESTIVDCTVKPPKLVREGAVKPADIEKILRSKQVLFVCTGNSCRSVMAQYLLRKKLDELGRRDVEVISAGIMRGQGMPASLETMELLKQEGIDSYSHRSQPVTQDMLNKADLILVMEELHENHLLQMSPQAKNRMYLLREFVDGSSAAGSMDIPDPIGKSIDYYRQTFALIKQAVEKVSTIL